MQEETITLKIPAHTETDEHGTTRLFVYFPGITFYTVRGKNLASAKDQARRDILEAMDRLECESLNQERAIIGCTTGTIMIVEYRDCQWLARLAGPMRTTTYSIELAAKSYRDAINEAKEKALDYNLGEPMWTTLV